MEYLPFGELLVDEHTNSYNSPFKYNGKEFDEETGNYFYGARYYDPKWSIFISVDPLAEQYPNISPYAYVANNPIIYIDPDGREIKDGKEIFDKFKDFVTDKIKSSNGRASDLKERATAAFDRGKESKGERLNRRAEKAEALAGKYNEVLQELNILESSDQVYNIYLNSSSGHKSGGGNTEYDTSTDAINVNLKGGYDKISLSHELKHAYQYETGAISFGPSGKTGGALYDLQDEYEAYSRGALFGGSAYSIKRLQKMDLYEDIRERTSQRTLDTSTGLGGTMGGELRTLTKNSYRAGKSNGNYYKGWKNYYKK